MCSTLIIQPTSQIPASAHRSQHLNINRSILQPFSKVCCTYYNSFFLLDFTWGEEHFKGERGKQMWGGHVTEKCPEHERSADTEVILIFNEKFGLSQHFCYYITHCKTEFASKLSIPVPTFRDSCWTGWIFFKIPCK